VQEKTYEEGIIEGARLANVKHQLVLRQVQAALASFRQAYDREKKYYAQSSTRRGAWVELFENLCLALRKYKEATGLLPATVIDRALICYWTAQGTREAGEALVTAGRRQQ
jgi:hypothetical protein